MERRLGFVGLVLEDRLRSAAAVNEVLSAFGDRILARVGIPHLRGDSSVITLVIEASTDELGRLTGKLGMLPGVSVKSALTKAPA
jgi:putative iron-only hydrogenase system regulator